MKRRFVGVSVLLMGLLSITSCNGEKGGEQQASDVASEINEEVANEEFDPSDSEEEPKNEEYPELDQEFEYNSDDKKDYLITIKTSKGDIKVLLYDETIGHKKNFVKLASLGFYDNTAFHRIMNEFMIQGGDPNSRGDDSSIYGTGGPGYTIPAEFNSKFIHKRGAIAAARTGGPQNPNKESSGSQFYIVHGKKVNTSELKMMQEQKQQGAKFEAVKMLLNKPENVTDLQKVMKYQQARNQSGVDSIVAAYTPEAEKIVAESPVSGYTGEQLKIYEEIGGTPFLDNEYTVYGEVVKGLDVVDALAAVAVGGPQNSLPNEKVVMTVEVELLKKKKITKLTGYEY